LEFFGGSLTLSVGSFFFPFKLNIQKNVLGMEIFNFENVVHLRVFDLELTDEKRFKKVEL
jgi:hypothetical protein